jgi:hypothetical protein
MEYVGNNYAGKLPVHRNAWLDWWSDGYGSTSRETAEIRNTQNMKQVDEGLFTMVSIMGGQLSPALEANLDHISENVIFFDEHTCGASRKHYKALFGKYNKAMAAKRRLRLGSSEKSHIAE